MRKKLKGSPWRVVSVEAREDQHLWLEFADGNSGVVDMAPIFGDDASFDDLKDPKAFAGFEIAYHTVQWGEDRTFAIIGSINWSRERQTRICMGLR